MKGTQSKTRGRKSAPLTKRELIIQAWERLGRAAIGERELSEIQKSARDQAGASDDASPAAIARVLADEGAELRHPEVLEFDARWRKTRIESEDRDFDSLEALLNGKPIRLSQAETVVKKLEQLRLGGDKFGKEARRLAVEGRQLAELLSRDQKLDKLQRAEQAEIAEWLKVWIQTPSLFADWLDLRRRSPEFQKKFLGGQF